MNRVYRAPTAAPSHLDASQYQHLLAHSHKEATILFAVGAQHAAAML